MTEAVLALAIVFTTLAVFARIGEAINKRGRNRAAAALMRSRRGR